ncbi:hypothetical protein [Marinobacter sp.]|uniref:hypothetical protein n=1 Tax=Marinobacter sp. TaxID=50741 RepID=UPI0035C7502F
MSETKCTCKWNPDRHNEDCPVFLKDENARLQSEVERLRGRCGELEDVIAKSKTALRKHRWCGDYYPENGWPEVNEALAEAQRLRQQAAESENE